VPHPRHPSRNRSTACHPEASQPPRFGRDACETVRPSPSLRCAAVPSASQNTAHLPRSDCAPSINRSIRLAGSGGPGQSRGAPSSSGRADTSLAWVAPMANPTPTRITRRAPSSACRNGFLLAHSSTQAWVRTGVGASRGARSQRACGINARRCCLQRSLASSRANQPGTAADRCSTWPPAAASRLPDA